MSDVLIGISQDDLGTTSGDNDAEDTNFGSATPKAAMTFMSRGTTVNTTVDQKQVSCGAAQSDTADETWTFYSSSRHGVSSTDTDKKSLNDKTCWKGTQTASRDGHYQFSSFGTNKVVWDIDNTFTSDFNTFTVLFGGADLDVVVGTLDASSLTSGSTVSATVNIDMTNAALVLVGNDTNYSSGSSPATSSTRQAIGMGSYDGTTFRQAAVMVAENNGQGAGDPCSYLNDSRIFQRCNIDSGLAEYALEWTAADSTSFTLTVRDSTAASTAKIGYIAFALPSDWNAYVSVEDIPTSGTNPIAFAPGFSGWTPQVLFQVLTMMEAVNTAYNSALAGSLGIRVAIGTGSDDGYTIASAVEYNADPTNTECGVYDSGFLNEDDGTAGIDMDLSSFDSGGWSETINTFPAAVKKSICLVMGEDDAAGANPKGPLGGLVFGGPFRGPLG